MRKRRGIGGAAVLFGVLMAVSSLFVGVTVAGAHHTEYWPERECDNSWSAQGVYIGGEEERLVVLSNIVINGVPLNSVPGFHPYDPGTDGPTQPPVSGLAWIGTSTGFTIFQQSGSNFLSGAANWSGTMSIFRDVNGTWEMSRVPVGIYEPEGPTDCEPATATATSTWTVPANTATPTATATLPSNTATPTTPANTPTPTTPANTPTPTKTATPPGCYPPGTPPPGGGTNCTPTPTYTPANTSTPTPTKTATPPGCYPPGTPPPGGGTNCTPTPTATTPPCVYNGTPVPPGGSTCTPTPTPPGCVYNGTPVPPGGSLCTPTPVPGCVTPGGGAMPPGSTICTPTPINDVQGVKTPGPQPPSAGTGFGDRVSNANMMFALLGLLAVTAGGAFMALGRQPEED